MLKQATQSELCLTLDRECGSAKRDLVERLPEGRDEGGAGGG